MSGLPTVTDETVNGVDVREQGNALRVATNIPHLVSLGTGRLSTAVTLHPIKQGRVTIGSDPTCDIYVAGTGVCNIHCRVENSHGVVTIYPINGSTLLDGLLLEKATRLSQGSMLTIGRSNYLRFNHPEEAKLMKSVLPTAHLSMAPIQYQPNEDCTIPGYAKPSEILNSSYQRSDKHHSKPYKDNPLKSLDLELEMSIKEFNRQKPPVAPRKPYRDLDYSDSNSDQESQKPKMSSIMSKVSKFEYYAKSSQKNLSRSQFYTYTDNTNDISPKVFSSNSLTVNTPAKDVLGGKEIPTSFINKMNKENHLKTVALTDNNTPTTKNCSYANVTVRNKTKIDDILRNFDKPTKKINNDQQNLDNIYGRINKNIDHGNFQNENFSETKVKMDCLNIKDNNDKVINSLNSNNLMVKNNLHLPCSSFDRNPEYSPVYANSSQLERNMEAESKRKQAYQDRVKEENEKEVESARLDEILNMCAEYEKQITSGNPITPTEKKSQNKIITNGSLPRSVVINNPNFVQTSEGYYKFDTSHIRNNGMSQSLPTQRNYSTYENFDITQLTNTDLQKTPEVSIRSENRGRMDEIGIPITDSQYNFPITELSSPLMIRKMNQNNDLPKIPLNSTSSPIGSPYENLYLNRNLKPKSPNTQSPRSRIKTTFAHKNLPSPQYFIFPTPPPKDNSKKPDFDIAQKDFETSTPLSKTKIPPKIPEKPDFLKKVNDRNVKPELVRKIVKCEGIEKQLSLEEEIPMIDDTDLSDDIEFRYSKVLEPRDDTSPQPIEVKVEIKDNTNSLTKNQSFDDVKNELMADIPELIEFEKDLKENSKNKIIKNITASIRTIDLEAETAIDINDENIKELKQKYDNLKEERRKLLTEIHEIKRKMNEIRSHEDDILKELEMEKALIKGEYDSEIAILNIEQKKKIELTNKSKKIEEEVKSLKQRQESRQTEMSVRVEIATLKVERIQSDLQNKSATIEELKNAQDILDNEIKIYEDLEFQQLEEESELLANREAVQNELTILSKKIDSQKARILTLKSEATDNLTSALDETKILQAENVRLLNRVEELTSKVQIIEKELKPLVVKLNDIERTQSPDSAFYTDQTRAKSGEFGYSPQSSDSDDLDILKISNFEEHTKELHEKFTSIDHMSQSMIVDLERRDISELLDDNENSRSSESPSKTSTCSKEKKGFWERNFDSLSRKKSKDKKSKSQPPPIDIMSQSLNENLINNNENIEAETNFERFNSLKLTKNKNKVTKSNSSSKIPTFAALGKIIKKDSFVRKPKENVPNNEEINKNRYVKNSKALTDNKYTKSKSLSPDKITNLEEKNNHKTIDFAKILHRKSCGDEPGLKSLTENGKISDSGKIPSQDDIDRISKVTIDAPILSSDTDMNSLGRKTLDSLKEIEKKRMEMLEEQGCQVMENEREKIQELKRRVQDETKKLWDQKQQQTKNVTELPNDSRMNENELDSSFVSERTNSLYEKIDGNEDLSYAEESFNLTGTNIFDESSGFASSSIEELQVRNSRTDSLSSRPIEDDKRSDDSRPLSNASDFSRDNIISGLPLSGSRRRRTADLSRPLTRYLPVDREDFDLRTHIETAGHQVDLCPHVVINSSSCRGYLHKLGAKFHTWSKRWFVFDRDTKTFVYYWDKSEKKPRGGAYFQVIEEVYLDHANVSKSPNPQMTFIVKTRQRRYYLMSPSGESARIWIDVLFSGAQGYNEYLE